MAKELINLSWIEELLPKGYIRKPMFGGFAFYFEGRLILVMFENTGDRSYKDKKYKFEIWNGCLFPAERDQHAEILQQYPILINHPVLPKWLYLPLDTEDFESHVEKLLKELRRRNPRFGVIPKPKKSKIKKAIGEKPEKTNTRRPSMFDEGRLKKKRPARR